MKFHPVQLGLPSACLLFLLSATLTIASARQPGDTPSRKPRRGTRSAAADLERSGPRVGDSRTGDSKKKSARRGLLSVTPEREAAAMTFVRQHHMELSELLKSLRASKPRIYQRAMADLFRTSERLTQIQERQPDRYDLELEFWKAQSRVQLIAARLSMGDAPKLRQQLREALIKQVDAKKRLLLLERSRLEARLAKLEGQIKRLDSGQARHIEQQVKLFTRLVKPASGVGKSAPTRDVKRRD